MKRVVIIGGGITGLAAAHRLLERRIGGPLFDVTLLEASERLGGVIQTEHRDGFLLERGPDSFLSEKPETTLLAQRLGLEPHLIETNQKHRRSFVVRHGRLRPVPQGFHLLAPARLWPFLASDIFSWRAKARMAMDLVLPRRTSNGSADESLAQFVRRRFGREALERMAQPMVGGIYTADPEQLSLRATMPRFLEMEREHRSVICALRKENRGQTVKEGSAAASGARYNLFLSFDGGMQMLVDRLAAQIPQETVRLNTRVESLKFDQGSGIWIINQNPGDSIRADAVCLALPAYAAASLVRDTNSNLAAELEAIPYASTATINLAYKRPDVPYALDGFGFVVPFVEKRSLLACTFSSIKFSRRAPDGFVLLRVFVGGALQPEIFSLDEKEMIKLVLADLRNLLGIAQPPVFSETARWARSMPQYHMGHLDRVKRIESLARQIPNLRLAGNAYSGAGISDCIRGGESAAEEILSSA